MNDITFFHWKSLRTMLYLRYTRGANLLYTLLRYLCNAVMIAAIPTRNPDSAWMSCSRNSRFCFSSFLFWVKNCFNLSILECKLKIQRNEKLLSLPTTGMTDYKNIGRIDLLPNAFLNEEQLVRTLIHEKCHVMQLKKHGARYAQDNLQKMEAQAYCFEDFWYSRLVREMKQHEMDWKYSGSV